MNAIAGAGASRSEAGRRRIGLIGFGFIGAQVYRRLRDRPELGLDVAFVHNRDAARLADVPRALVLDHLDDDGALAARGADLVVEMAHPAITRRHGERILANADYLPLSVTALADDGLLERLVARANEAGTRLLIPHGALPGVDSLREWRHMWDSVTITFRKSPRNIDFSESGIDPTGLGAAVEGIVTGVEHAVEHAVGNGIGPSRETVVYDGPARGIARLFPRNVNTMVTCALATVGLDRCRARLVAVPGLRVAIAEIEARGRDGSLLTMRKEQPAVGVSGTEMFESQFGSILRAAGAGDTLDFV